MANGRSDLAPLIAQNDAIRRRAHELSVENQELETMVAQRDRAIDEYNKKGAQRLAIAAVGGFGIASGLAFLAHDELANFFGRATAPALLLIPGAGAIVFWQAKKRFKKMRAVPLETKLATYGGALGLVLTGGYLSWEDWSGTQPSAPAKK